MNDYLTGRQSQKYWCTIINVLRPKLLLFMFEVVWFGSRVYWTKIKSEVYLKYFDFSQHSAID